MSWRAGCAPLTILLSLAGGCTDRFADDAFGTLQLDTLVVAGEVREVPDRIDPQGGFVSGERGEFYDFGPVPTVLSAETFEPISARVPPMYFFFTKDGRPLFAPPVREARDRIDYIPGGKGVRNPNPKDFCVPGADPVGCLALNEAQKNRVYSIRYRDLWVDPLRGVADYQRPLVDFSPADVNGARALYTGLWEIVEVIVPDGYDPDAIKHKKTLDAALKSGDYVARPTGKVINCPIVDERSNVPPGITETDNFHPRMEIWYRRKLAWCYLANGWLTLGDAKGNRYPANADAARLQTFDVDQVVVGQGKSVQAVTTVPVRRAYVPNVINFDDLNGLLETRIAGQILAGGRPRKTPADPPGYSPIRWMWDIIVTGEYVPDSLTDEREVDELQARPTQETRNLATRGVTRRCSLPKEKANAAFAGQCGVLKQNPDTKAFYIDGSVDPVCNEIGLECNPETCFCDVPQVKYGQRCGFGVGRCASPDPNDPFWEDGYSCFPPDLGFCYLGCDANQPNDFEAQNEGREPRDFVDSRCDSVRGYRCFSVGARGICLKLCDENLNETVGAAQCEAFREKTDPATMMSVREDLGRGQSCENLGVEVCLWPEGYAR